MSKLLSYKYVCNSSWCNYPAVHILALGSCQRWRQTVQPAVNVQQAVTKPYKPCTYVKSGNTHVTAIQCLLLLISCAATGSRRRKLHMLLTIWENALSCFPGAQQNRTAWRRGKLGSQTHPEKHAHISLTTNETHTTYVVAWTVHRISFKLCLKNLARMWINTICLQHLGFL